jgi:hypothetical protein
MKGGPQGQAIAADAPDGQAMAKKQPAFDTKGSKTNFEMMTNTASIAAIGRVSDLP